MWSLLSWRRFASLQTAVFLLFVSALIGVFLHRLPIEPVITNDSEGFVNFSPIRPHGYPLFLAGYRWVWGDLTYLPAIQAAIYLVSIGFLSIAIGRRLNSLLAGLGLFLMVYAFLDPNDLWSVMSEPLYAAALTAACGALVFYAIHPHRIALITASAFMGIAITCRTIGLALLPAFLFSLLWHSRGNVRERARLLIFAIVPIGIFNGLATTSNFHQNGSFSVASAGGISLLGKGLLLAQPLPPDHRLARFNWIADVARPARQAIARLHNPFLKALVERQYYEYLRWFVTWPAFESTWPAWQMGGEAERAELAGQLAKAYVINDVPGYLRLVSLDYLSLWTVPRWLTTSEELGFRTELAVAAPIPLLTEFEQTPAGQLEYFQVIPSGRSAVFVYAMRGVVAAFWAVTMLTAWLLFTNFRYLLSELPDLAFMVFGVHSVYVGTALVEAGLERYVWPTWPILIAAVLIGASLLMRIMTSSVNIPRLPR